MVKRMCLEKSENNTSLKKRKSEFISRAKTTWGEEYDYEDIEYVASHIPITLVCKMHGAFMVRPSNHIKTKNPCGCPKCSKVKQAARLMKPFSEFLAQARAAHGERYTYLEHTYQGAKKHMTIMCPEHGAFEQQPDSHLNRGNGCKKCATVTNLAKIRHHSVNEIASEISRLSNNKVRLHSETFTRINSEATFTCQDHGIYARLVNSAINSKCPCVECSKQQGWYWYSEEQCLDSIKLALPTEIEFVDLDFKGSNNSIIRLRCHIHGEFQKLGSSFRNNHGCPSCGIHAAQPTRTLGLRKRMELTKQSRFENWLLRAKKKHNGKFDYSLVLFSGQNSPVNIICPTHGIFSQTPFAHLSSGCRLCADEQLSGAYSLKIFKRDPDLARSDGLLYYVQFNAWGQRFFKVGITLRDVKTRFSYAKGQGVLVTELASVRAPLLQCFLAEQYLIDSHVVKYPFTDKVADRSLSSLRIGQTETFATHLPTEYADLKKVLARFMPQTLTEP